MAGTPTPKQWKIGMACICRTLVCQVKNIEKNALGITEYVVEFVDTGDLDRVKKHELTELEIEDLDNKAFSVPNFQVSDVKTASTRHVWVNEEQINAVANARLSEKTESQTRWAVSLFKGKARRKSSIKINKKGRGHVSFIKTLKNKI